MNQANDIVHRVIKSKALFLLMEPGAESSDSRIFGLSRHLSPVEKSLTNPRTPPHTLILSVCLCFNLHNIYINLHNIIYIIPLIYQFIYQITIAILRVQWTYSINKHTCYSIYLAKSSRSSLFRVKYIASGRTFNKMSNL